MMNFLNFKSFLNKLYQVNSFQVFALSFLICCIFYLFEGILGIDRFYHPDSIHYLSEYKNFDLKTYLSNPEVFFTSGFYKITNLLNDNYYLLIALNFTLFSFTNVFIFSKIFKNYFNLLDNKKLIILFYLLFLDPFRLHLTSHILKETILIFFIIIIITSKINLIKLFSLILLESVRPNSWIYMLVFLNFYNLKRFFKKKYFYFFFILILLLGCYLIYLNQSFSEIFNDTFKSILKKIKLLNRQEMPLRSYDNVIQFKEYDFPIGFILKNISWPFMLITGTFIFFVSSILFKFLGLIIIINHFFIFFISKKTFISLGLIIILIIISLNTSSYTAMFRYSYIALYSSVVYFFMNLQQLNNDKLKN